VHNRVSVIVATYGRPQLLARALRSCTSQLLPPFEVIVVHDGPKYMAQDAGYTTQMFFTDGHAGDWGATPRQIGADMAWGDYVAYLDDDNQFLPEHLQTLAHLAERTHADFVFSNDSRGIGNGRPEFGHIDTSCILHRRELLEKATWRPAGYAADWDLVERWLAVGATWAYSGQATVLYKRP
jgi:glycosyltransferase involved in cell wall biosynthesis